MLYLRATVICKRVNKTGLLNEQLIDFLFISISQYLSLQCFNHHATDGTFTFCFHFWITLSVLIHTAYILLRVFFCVFFASHVIWLSFCGSGWVFVFFFYQTEQSTCILAQRSNACCFLLCPIEGLLPHNKSKTSSKDIIPHLVQNNVPCQKQKNDKKIYIYLMLVSKQAYGKLQWHSCKQTGIEYWVLNICYYLEWCYPVKAEKEYILYGL